jgi:ABC-type branched-subunit amino acid transport system substrate-binding protein
MRKLFFVVLILTFSFSLVAAQEVRVGTLLPHSGELKEYGPHLKNAVMLAAKQLKAVGLKVTIIHEDTKTAVDPAIAAARKLVNLDRVMAIVGPMASELTIPVAEQITIPKRVLLITPASTSPLISMLPADQGKNFVFRTCPSDVLQGAVAGKLAAAKYKKASVLFVDNPYGQKLAEQFKVSFEQLGGQVLGYVPLESKRSSTYADKLQTALAGGPEVICAFSYPEHAKLYVQQAWDIHRFNNFLYCDGTKSLDIVKTVGAQTVEGKLGTAPIAAKGQAYNLFDKAYKVEYKKLLPLPFIANAYDATVLVGLAAAAAMAEGKPITAVNIRNCLHKVATPPGEKIMPGEFAKAMMMLRAKKDIDYVGASGPVNFDINGDVVTPIEIWQFKNGTMITKSVEDSIR